MVLFFQRFDAGDLVDEDVQVSALLCCKCLLKLLTEYMSCVLLLVTWLPRELKWPLLMFLFCVNVGHVLFFFSFAAKQDKGSGYDEVDHEEKRKSAVAIPWLPDLSHGKLLAKRELVRERKSKCISKYSRTHRFHRLIKLCADKLGTTQAVNVLGQLGRKTGVNEYNALIKVCVQKARVTDDEYIALSEMSKAFHLFKSMRDCGYPLEEQTYDPLLRYIIDMGLVQEFQLFSDFIKAENPGLASRLGYYEMLLWLRVDNEEMIRDICEFITVDDREDTSALRGWLINFNDLFCPILNIQCRILKATCKKFVSCFIFFICALVDRAKRNRMDGNCLRYALIML